MSTVLFVLNDPPYGTERSYNGLRLAAALARQGETVRVFLVGDAAACAKRGQLVPKGYYNLEVMIGSVLRHQGEVAVCGTCMDARGIADGELVDGTRRGTLDELARWTLEAERHLVF